MNNLIKVLQQIDELQSCMSVSNLRLLRQLKNELKKIDINSITFKTK